MSTKVVALLMIKNESRIIERCIRHLLPTVDAFYFYDTGSTDNTIEVILETMKGHGKSYAVGGEPFVNFGVSRSASFVGCVKFAESLAWDLGTCYALAVDADMNVVEGAAWAQAKQGLTKNGYSIIQKNSAIEYYNMRLLRLDGGWTCVGATHEYWSGEGTEKLPKDALYIDDRGDGGCKADKFTRDERLLREELIAEPTNARAHFYLAQTLKCLRRKEEAIALYKKRIALGGWWEEVWYSHYMIAELWRDLGRVDKMETWVQRGYAHYPKRAEAIYMALMAALDRRDYGSAQRWWLLGKDIPYPAGDSLFIEGAPYNGGFAFQGTILHYYLYKDNAVVRSRGADLVISYVNRWSATAGLKNSMDNLLFYVEPLRAQRSVFLFADVGTAVVPHQQPFTVGNSSILRLDDDSYLMNLRMVDYRYVDGAYVWADGKTVNTRNYLVHLDSELRPKEKPVEIAMSYAKDQHYRDARINGIEDVRLYRRGDGRVGMYGCTANLGEGGAIQMCTGILDKDSKTYVDVKLLASPERRSCEKNWCFWGECGVYVYQWSPYTLYSVDSGALVLKKNMPAFFQHLRGSTRVVGTKDGWYVLTHGVVQRDGRRVYIHVLVELDRLTLAPKAYTVPFCFESLGTEYCVGMDLRDGEAWFVYTKNDRDLTLGRVPWGDFRWINA
jgi:hypothetical protein